MTDSRIFECITHTKQRRTQFNLLQPTDGSRQTNSLTTFSWREAIDPNDSDTVYYNLFLKDGRDTVSFAFTNTTVAVDLDTVLFDLSDRITDILWWVVGVSGEDTVRSEESFWLYLFPNDIATDNRTALPYELTLDCSPNPFNSTTTVHFSLPGESYVTLELFDLQGRLVSRLNYTKFVAGAHRVVVGSSHFTSGMYILRLISDYGVLNHSVTLVK